MEESDYDIESDAGDMLPSNRKKFGERLEELRLFVLDNGRFPKEKVSAVEKKLHGWCGSQRIRKRQSVLSENQILELEGVPGWFWSSEDKFTNRCVKLIEWIGGNDRLPKSTSKDPDEKVWATFCKRVWSLSEANQLTEEQKDLFEEVEKWEWKIGVRRNNKNMISLLELFVKEHNRLPIRGDEKELVVWCRIQQIAKAKDTITEKMVGKLEGIKGWVWGDAESYLLEGFDRRYNDLVEWVKKKGKVPNTREKDQFVRNLAQWCTNQRQKKKVNLLTQDQIDRFERLPGWHWVVKPAPINKSFEEILKEYKDAVTDRLPIEQRLKDWYVRQIKKKESDKLDAGKLEKLNELIEIVKAMPVPKKILVKGRKRDAVNEFD
ncbi:MAG: hypothetical protein Hyperionvirus4_146 [Hyperionvirus sp.]|uniref:Helicase-associated domain-containing protein n=1 Tax=Hyperionvirus sp. TaxID=2487770 RepID=A0A3G5AAD3_9VIRU|nr:MAG: hypothetical protein Hyperionvirus4_146 [Hyperionvirus sp.]